MHLGRHITNDVGSVCRHEFGGKWVDRIAEAVDEFLLCTVFGDLDPLLTHDVSHEVTCLFLDMVLLKGSNPPLHQVVKELRHLVLTPLGLAVTKEAHLVLILEQSLLVLPLNFTTTASLGTTAWLT